MTEFTIKRVLAQVLFGTTICESYNNQKIVDFFYNELLLEKLLAGEPVSVPELRKLLRKKILNFEFIKLDGEDRPAKGTTMMKYIPQSDHPKGIRPSSPKVATFYDLDKKAWRSVSNRSKEVVLKYAFGEKKKPVFVVRDKDQEVEEPTTKEEEPMVKPTVTREEEPEVIDVDVETTPEEEPEVIDVETMGMPDVEPVLKPKEETGVIGGETMGMPTAEPIIKQKSYGFRPKRREPKEEVPSPAEDIEDIIVRPKIGWKPKAFKKPEEVTKILLPRPVGRPLEEPEETRQLTPGPKPPPLSIEPDENEII